jgi:hypothetical protein
MTEKFKVGPIELNALPDGWTPIAATAIVKCLDEDAKPTWCIRTSDDMTDEELLGVLVIEQDLVRQRMLDAYAGGDDES